MSGDGATGRKTMAQAFRHELHQLIERYRSDHANLKEMSQELEYELSYLDVAILKQERATIV